MAHLIPVSQWVYSLYEVKFFTSENGQLLRTDYITSSSDNHLRADLDERACDFTNCNWYEWKVITDNVGHPHSIGSFYGRSISESGWAHAQWLIEAFDARRS